MNLSVNKALLIVGVLAFAAGAIIGSAFVLFVLR